MGKISTIKIVEGHTKPGVPGDASTGVETTTGSSTPPSHLQEKHISKGRAYTKPKCIGDQEDKPMMWPRARSQHIPVLSAQSEEWGTAGSWRPECGGKIHGSGTRTGEGIKVKDVKILANTSWIIFILSDELFSVGWSQCLGLYMCVCIYVY